MKECNPDSKHITSQGATTAATAAAATTDGMGRTACMGEHAMIDQPSWPQQTSPPDLPVH